ncbi:MAG: sugar kinase, partial [Caulobacter sp.]
MVDLNVEMAELWGSLGAPAAGRAHVVQFVSARRGEGTSTVAREFARFASKRAGRRT